jgi:hypothetical protein
MPVPPKPTIKITFNGLLVLAFDQTHQQHLCEIGVLKAHGHTLRISRTTTDSAGAHTLPEIANGIQTGGISIGIPERNAREGVRRFNNENDAGDPENFRWIVDIEDLHEDRHPDGLSLKTGFPRQSVLVRQGLFHTATQIPARLVRPGGTEEEIKIASPIGCNLYMENGEKFVLSYGQEGEKLEIVAENGVTHEITILNTPPNDSHNQASGQVVHFPFFYELALEVDPKEQFNIVKSETVKSKTKLFLGNPQRPCPGVLLGKRTRGLTTGAE